MKNLIMNRQIFSIMVIWMILLTGLFGMSNLTNNVNASRSKQVSGIISTNTTWTVTNSPYFVTGNLLVQENVNLTIQPGVTVKFNKDVYLMIEGSLYAVGTAINLITFTSNSSSPKPGDWQAIRFTNKCDKSIFKYCVIEYSTQVISSDGVDIDISYCTLRNNDIVGIQLKNGNHTISNNLFKNNVVGIRIKYSLNNVKIYHNTFENNTGWGLLVEGGPCEIINNTFLHNSGGAKCMVNYTIVKNNLFVKNNISLSMEDEDGIISHNIIKDSTFCGVELSAFYGIMRFNNITNNHYGFYVDKHGYGYPMNSTVYKNNIDQSVKNSVFMTYDKDVNFQNNWWGTNNSISINNSIHDYYDNFDLGKVIYKPFLNSSIDIDFPDNKLPFANAGPDQNVYVNQTVNFNGSGTYDLDNDTLVYNWDFGDGTSTNWQYNCNSSHMYNIAGNYTVTLFVSDGAGGWPAVNDTCIIRVINSSPLAKSQWPMFMNNLQHTSMSKYTSVNNAGKLLWKYETGGAVGSPSIDSNGTIYFGSNDDFLYALYPNGKIKWFCKTTGYPKSTPAISSDGTVYANCGGTLHSFSSNGYNKWTFGDGSNSDSSPTIGPDGTIYFINNEHLNAIFHNGNLKWKFKVGNIYKSSPAIDSNGILYIGSHEFFYAIYPNGTLKWKFNQGNDPIYASPSIDSKGTIYIGSTDDYLYALNPDGSEKWKYPSDIGHTSPVIDKKDIIYVGSNYKFHAIHPNGSKKWVYETGSTMSSSPAISSDGIIYITTYDNHLIALYPNGTEKWKFKAEKSIYSSPAISANGTVFFGSSDWYFYAIGGKSNPINYPPIPNAGPDQNISINQTVNFDGSGTYDPDGDTLSYKWSFGDGTSTNWQYNSNSSHMYNKSGKYTVTLYVSDGAGGWGTVNDTCIVFVSENINLTPIIKSNFPTLIELDEDFSEYVLNLTEFEHHTNVKYTNDNLNWYVTMNSGMIFSITSWNSTGLESDTFIYTSLPNKYGEESLSYHLYDPNGIQTTIYQTVIVHPVNDRPIANAGPDRNVTFGQKTELNGSESYDIEGNISSYNWSSNLDGYIGSGKILNNVSLSSGEHTITLNVSDGELTALDTCMIIVSKLHINQPPIPKIVTKKVASEGERVNLSTNGSYDSDGYITTYIWDFGDGSKKIYTNRTYIEHTWNDEGNYTINLTVIDNDGGIGYVTFHIHIEKIRIPDPNPKQPQDYTLTIILFVIVIIILLTILSFKLFLTKSKRQREKVYESDKDIIDNMQNLYVNGEPVFESDYSHDEISEILENKFKAGQVSDETYHFIRSQVIFTEENHSDKDQLDTINNETEE